MFHRCCQCPASIFKTNEGLRHLSMQRQQQECFQVKYSSFIISSVVGHYSSSRRCCRISLSFGRCDLQSRFAINSQSLSRRRHPLLLSLSRQIAFGNPFLPLFLLAPLPSTLAPSKNKHLCWADCHRIGFIDPEGESRKGR